MKTKRRGFLFFFLLILAVLCIIIGEVGLYGTRNLMEYAAPYSNQSETNIPLLNALDDLKEQLPDAQLSASVLATSGWVQTSAGEFTTCAITAVAPGWFDLYHHTLLDGRYMGEAEIIAGEHVALMSGDLAYALWGDTDAVGNEIQLNGTTFRVIGLIDPPRRLGLSQQSMLYIPLPAAFHAQVQADIQILSALSGRENQFEHTAKRYLPDGTFYHHARERMSATMPVRYLCVAMLLFLLRRALRMINRFSEASKQKWRDRYARVYGGQMIAPSILLGLQDLVTYGLWVLAAYVTLQLAIAPVYVFSEWIPADLSSLSSYVDAFVRAAEDWFALRRTFTNSVLQIRCCGTFINIGSILFLLAMALPRKLLLSSGRIKNEGEKDKESAFLLSLFCYNESAASIYETGATS